MTKFDTPILIIIFNRPDKVAKLIESLSHIKPTKLFIAADGPRKNKSGEESLCEEARAFATKIPWECEVHTRFLEQNQGCKAAVSGAVSWFFEQVEVGIVLEDDCIPEPVFFSFCEEMLEKYKDNEQVMHINGTSFLPRIEPDFEDPYFLSRIAHSWGWASWRRAWKHYDPNFTDLDKLFYTIQTNQMLTSKKSVRFLVKHFRHILEKRVDSWANPWMYSILTQNGLCITPKVSLVKNIGFDTDATNTKKVPTFYSEQNIVLDMGDFNSPTKHPDIDTKIITSVFMPHRVRSLFQKWYDVLISFLKHA